MPGDAKPVDASLVAIGEISRLTGINSVTLRAWERRYGLLKPQRTHKGHRLYSQADVARVREIQTWLARGLAVSKIKALLANPDTAVNLVLAHESLWQEAQHKLLGALQTFNRRQLESLLDEFLSLYPITLLADQLFQPLLERWHGDTLVDNRAQPQFLHAQAQQAFLTAVMQEQICRLQYRQRQVTSGAPILLCTTHAQEPPLLPLFFNYALLLNQQPADFLQHLTAGQAAYCSEHLSACLLVVCGYGYLNPQELQVFLQQWFCHSPTPVMLLGPVARLYQASQLASTETLPGLVMAFERQQQALLWINRYQQGQHTND